MKLYHIAAISENSVIAKEGAIPWDIKDDLRRFAQITKGHAIIMGSGTFKSMGSRALPGRLNVVLSTQQQDPVEDVVFCASIEDALVACVKQHEVYIIGGGKVYGDTMYMVDELRITVVHQDVPEDESCVYYPEIDEEEWAMSFLEVAETHSYIDYVRTNLRK